MVLEPGSGSIGSGAICYAKLTYRELGSSHERPIQADVHVQIRGAISRNRIAGENVFYMKELTPLDPSRKMRSEIPLLLVC